MSIEDPKKNKNENKNENPEDKEPVDKVTEDGLKNGVFEAAADAVATEGAEVQAQTENAKKAIDSLKSPEEKEKDMEKMRATYVKILNLYKEEAQKQVEALKSKKGFFNKLKSMFDEGSSEEALKQINVVILNTMKKNPEYQNLSIMYPETDRTLGRFDFSSIKAYDIIKQELGEEKAKELKTKADKQYPSSVVGGAPAGVSV